MGMEVPLFEVRKPRVECTVVCTSILLWHRARCRLPAHLCTT